MNPPQIIILCFGSLVVLAGLLLFWTPIPVGFILIPLGFYILGTKFTWAQGILNGIKTRTGPFGRAVQRAEVDASAWFDRLRR